MILMKLQLCLDLQLFKLYPGFLIYDFSSSSFGVAR